MKPKNNEPLNDNLAGFIAEMRQLDARRSRVHWVMALCLLPLGLFFLLYGGAGHPAIGLLGFGFLLAITYMVIMALLYQKIDYGAPVHTYLLKTAQRYRFWTSRRALATVPILLVMGFAGGWTVWLTALKYFNPRGGQVALAIYGCCFFALVAFALTSEWRKWKRTGAPLLESIQRHLAELE